MPTTMASSSDASADTAPSVPGDRPADPALPVAQHMAQVLGETERAACSQIARSVRVLGAERALALLAQAVETEQRDGLLTRDGTRRRTPGGVYLTLVKECLGGQEYRRLVAPGPRRAGRAAPPTAERPVPAAPAAWTEETFRAVIAELEFGEARTVKITVIGRPARVVEQENVVIVGLRSTKVPTLPKGVPAPAAASTDYAVFIARKQWQGVVAALQDPEDALIVEGYPTLDPRFKTGVTVLATQATTRKLQAAKRAARTA